MIEILISDFLKDSFLFDIPKFCIDKKNLANTCCFN